ncbi:cupin domain-containing protein [Thermodesulfobacteriota bacterium]
MSTILRKSRDMQWAKIGEHIDIDDADLPGVRELKAAEAAVILDFAETDHFGAVFEKWPAVSFDWHYECDEMFYIVSGGPIKVICDGEEMEGAAGDTFYFTRGTDLRFEIKAELTGLTVHFPDFATILGRYKEYAQQLKK